ncbi:hypothetical protein PVAP13_9KG233900 [Panicum virgatum]|uniref:Uncharacterized protein n=1 Tax=Panicum virgatum TaxID=38727 RepID=A0A8T0NUB0_PANVG|nr:hypothetical protein PVAP13_9KG233900 [Panicum virgatum]
MGCFGHQGVPSAMWALWKTRNKLVFEDKVIQKPEVVIYKLLALLLHGKILAAEKNRIQVEEMIEVIHQACDLGA